MTITPHHINVKNLIRKHDFADSFTTSRFSFSPYRACEHGCVYCDGRAERYYVEGDFEKDIVVRQNAPERLSIELYKLREKGILSIGSGVSDAYQPVEAHEKIMVQCAEILTQTSRPVSLMTKSSLVERDLALWAEVNRKSQVRIACSIAFADDNLRKVFEPNASPLDERFRVLKRFKDAGCKIGVLALPLLPLITDTNEHLGALAQKIKEIKPDFVTPGGLTLRPGIQKDTFLSKLRVHFPEHGARYLEIYGENKPSGMMNWSYQQELGVRLSRFMADLGVPSLIPHSAYKGVVALYDEVHILLSHMAELYSYRGVDTRSLRQSITRYASWLKLQRSHITRSRKRSFCEIEDHLRFACTTGEICDILGNNRLADFTKRVVVNREMFEYVSMKLTSDL